METKFELKENNKMTELVLAIETNGLRDRDSNIFYKNLVGVVSISKEFGPVEYGFALAIDMSLNGTKDAHTETFIQLTPFIELDEFETICQDNGINIIYEKAKKF